MNVDTGAIRLWKDLTPEERESGRWVKLGDDEYARAVAIEEHERSQRMHEIFDGMAREGPRDSGVIPPHLFGDRRRGFDATGKPY